MEELYKGYLIVPDCDDRVVQMYQHPNDNVFGCHTNGYVIVTAQDGGHTCMKWDGGAYVPLSYKRINNDYSGKINPRNMQQELAFDLLQDKGTTIKMLAGKFGSGKSYLMVATAMQLIKEGRYDKVVYIRNNHEVKNTKPIGALPGDTFDKMLPYAMPLADHTGGRAGLEYLISQDRVNIEPLGFIRGRDIKRSIIMCSEAENLTKEHVQLLIGRVGEGSALWLDGDLKQTDSKIFSDNSGMRACIEKLAGHPRFGYVHLEKSERSETAAMADLLD